MNESNPRSCVADNSPGLPGRQQRTVPSGAIRIAVDEFPGTEPTIVFVHPNRTSPRVWDHLIAASGRRERKLTPALRGHGASDWPEDGYTIEDHRDDLLAVIDSVGPGPVILCGQATGATLALMAAARSAPGRVLAVIAAQPAVAIPAAVNDLVQTQVAAQQRLKDRDAARTVLPFRRFWSNEVVEHHLDHMLMATGEGDWTWCYHAGGVRGATAATLERPDGLERAHPGDRWCRIDRTATRVDRGDRPDAAGRRTALARASRSPALPGQSGQLRSLARRLHRPTARRLMRG